MIPTTAPTEPTALGPNWFASVMGTGIVAVAIAGLPFELPGADVAALVVWLMAAALLVVVTAATAADLHRHRGATRRHLDDPVMAHFYGAPAMALMTVGAGALLVGDRVLGTGPALAVDAVLWALGTALGLVTAVLVPCLAITRHDVADDAAFGGWLMPIVPPMVSAATGALLVPHLPEGQARETMVAFGYLCFGLTLVASLLVIGSIWSRLVHHGLGPAALVPTLWIVLGPLGQSITAAHHLGRVAPETLPAPYGRALAALTVVYGLPVLGFALLWLALAIALTLRTARAGLPFTLGWWSFTFPVGTLVTGVSGLASVTGLVVLQWLAGLLCLGLVGAWVTVSMRTLRHVGGVVSRPGASGAWIAIAGPRRRDRAAARRRSDASGASRPAGAPPTVKA